MGMEPFVQADDNAFGHLIGSIPDPVANLQQAIAFKVGLQGKLADIAQSQAQTQAQQAQAAQVANKLSRAQMFQQDLSKVQQAPDPQSISALMMKYPEFADQVKGGWDLKDKAAKDADLTQLGEVYSAAASGNWDLAAKQAQARIDADKAAGNADPSDEAMIAQIQAAQGGDPQAQRAVLTALGTHIAAIAGPEHFSTIFGALKGGYTLDAGAVRYDENGNIVAESPFLKAADGSILERDGHGGTSPTTAAPAATTPGGDDGFSRAVAFTLKHEGGYNPHDMNGAPVNFGINQGANPGVDVQSLTPDEAKQIYKTKYWDKSGAANLPENMQTPYFDTYIINPSRAQQFLRASGGDPAKFMQLRENWMGSVAAKNPQYAKAYATRNADLRLQLQGGDNAPPADAAGDTAAAPPGYHVLVPGKGKDAPAGDQWTPQGTLTPIPGGPADKGPDSKPTDQELGDAATQFLLTGQMPALGMGGGGLKQQILAKRSELMRQLGISAPQLPAFQARYKADQASLDQNQKMLTALDASEGALRANAQQVLATQKALVDENIIGNGAPFLNSMRLKTYKQIGSAQTKANIKAYEDAVNAYATEYAKFMSSASGMSNTPSSDAARSQASELNDLGMGPSALASHIHQSMIEAQNKKQAVALTNQRLQQRLSSYIPSGPGAKPFNPQGSGGALPQGARFVGTYQGKRVIQLPNGKRMVEQ